MESHSEPGGKTAHQKFTCEEVHRSALANAVYNPRTISDEAAKRLKENIRRVGLVQPIIWNKRTGNILGGHQRIAALDSLHKSKDYTLTVAVVDLDEKTEKEQNIFLNNTNAGGDFDNGKLKELLAEIDAEMAGFNLAEVFQMFGEYNNQNNAEMLAKLSEETAATQAKYLEACKAKPKSMDLDYYCVVVFSGNQDRSEFSMLRKLDDNRYVNGAGLIEDIRELVQLRKEKAELARQRTEGQSASVLEDETEIPFEVG